MTTAAKQLDFRDALLLALTTAITLTIALYWQESIKDLVQRLVPRTTALWLNFAIAILITLIGVVLIYGLFKLFRPKVQRDLKSMPLL